MNYPTKQELQESIARETEQIHAEVNAKAKADGHTKVLSPSFFKCTACKMSLQALIKVAGPVAIAEIAKVTDLSEATIKAILKEGSNDKDKIILLLCEKMGMCS